MMLHQPSILSPYTHQTIQVQLLACLKWLGDFQILACIPPEEPVPILDVADLTGIAYTDLYRVVSFLISIGFLMESCPGHVGHSILSAQFVRNPSLLDAIMFIAETLTPAALQMANTTERVGRSAHLDESPFSIATHSSTNFAASCAHQPRLKRQATAYDCIEMNSTGEATIAVFLSLDWHNLGEFHVVEVRNNAKHPHD